MDILRDAIYKYKKPSPTARKRVKSTTKRELVKLKSSKMKREIILPETLIMRISESLPMTPEPPGTMTSIASSENTTKGALTIAPQLSP